MRSALPRLSVQARRAERRHSSRIAQSSGRRARGALYRARTSRHTPERTPISTGRLGAELFAQIKTGLVPGSESATGTAGRCGCGASTPHHSSATGRRVGYGAPLRRRSAREQKHGGCRSISGRGASLAPVFWWTRTAPDPCFVMPTTTYHQELMHIHAWAIATTGAHEGSRADYRQSECDFAKSRSSIAPLRSDRSRTADLGARH